MTTTTTFTPGPREYYDSRPNYVGEPSGLPYYVIEALPEDRRVVIAEGHMTEGDARLICAGPRLLEALQFAFDRLIDFESGDLGASFSGRDLEYVRDVIRDATA